ncbi:hypothetical protein K474DRAFT_1646647 [Panus rudis PR-1116 ss-1]|nr:hypothetical protein K474DRAFT_1646647 [Panus rudis PR-1116 ss-1]
MGTTSVFVLPNGEDFLMRIEYTKAEAAGIIALVVVSSISLAAAVGLIVSIAVSAWNTRKSVNPHMFVRSHAAAYLISLLLCDIMQAIGSIINSQWVQQGAVEFRGLCTSQGAIKHLADVGSAIWSLIIAAHTFWVLFLRLDTRRYILIATLVGGWSLVGLIVLAGPAILVRADGAPFYGISGYWCWISNHYGVPRITHDYMIMFISAFLSFLLYALIFLRLRGNITLKSWHIKFQRTRDLKWKGKETTDSQVITVAKLMLWYPIAYTLMVLPIALCRFLAWGGVEIPFGMTIFSDAIFLLSGLINVILFTTTRRVLPKHSVITRRITLPRSLTRSRGTSRTQSSRTITIDGDDEDMEKGKGKEFDEGSTNEFGEDGGYIDHHDPRWSQPQPVSFPQPQLGAATMDAHTGGDGMFKSVSSPDSSDVEGEGEGDIESYYTRSKSSHEPSRADSTGSRRSRRAGSRGGGGGQGGRNRDSDRFVNVSLTSPPGLEQGVGEGRDAGRGGRDGRGGDLEDSLTDYYLQPSPTLVDLDRDR